MPNVKVVLVWLCKTPAGWRRFAAQFTPRGRPRPGVVKTSGCEVVYPDGRFQVRYYDRRRMIYEDAGETPTDALTALAKKRAILQARIAAADAGLHLEETQPPGTLDSEAKRFVKAAVDRGSSEAAQVYEHDTREFIQVINRVYAKEITREDLTRYQRWLRDNHKSDRTIFNRWRNVRSFLLWLSLPVKEIARDRPRYEKTLPEVYTDAELKALFAATRDPRLALIWELLLKTGLREKEAVYLEWSAIDLQRGILKVRANPRYHFKVKDSEHREVPIESGLLAKLKERRRWLPSQKLVTGKTGDRPDSHLLRQLKRIVVNAQLGCGTCEGCAASGCEHWFLHKFRATYITTLLRRGMDLRTVMRLSGHSDLASVMRYLSPADNDSTRAIVNGGWVC